MEVANLSDLSLTFSGFGLQTLSANTVPINIYIGNGTPFNPSYVNLNSDNFSSGRRRVGMIVYVNETGFAYQYEIDNYESLWNAATGATGTVTSNRYDTQVRNNSEAGQNFIDAWTGSTIEGVSGTTREEAKWRIFHGTDTFVTGGTYFSATSTINLYRNDGVTIPISGITATGGSSSSGFTGGTVSGATNFTGGLTANTISATTYQNLPNTTFTGGTVSGATNFTNGLTANTISATTYLNLPNTTFTGGTVSGATNFTGGLTANTISATTYQNLPPFTGDYLPLSGGTVSGATNFTNGLTANTLNVTGNTLLSGLTANTISATTYYNVSSNFQYEIHVSQIDGNDTTGNGTLLNPVASITQALTLLTGSRKTIIVHPGVYTENVTVANGNTTIATSELTGANTLLSGTLTIGSLGSGSRISGLKMSNLVISGTAQAYISNCTVDTNVTKSSSGYVEIINTEMQCISGIQISGSGTTIINGNKNVGVSVSNASAQVIIKGCNSVVTPSASAGNLAIVDCIVTALGGNAITITGALTNLTLANSQVLVQAGNNVAPISVAGIYSIFNTVYDKANSSLTGTNTNSVDYFQFINADKFITQGGTSLQYVMGDGSLSNGFTGGTVSGATNFTGGLTANTISATTYVNLPTDIRTTGGTYSNNTFTFTNNTGGTYSVLFNTVTGLTINGNLTTTGNTSLQGVTATTISATTYLNLPSFTGDYLPLSGGTVSGVTNFNGGLTANTISATTYQNLPNTTFTGGTVSGATNFTGGLTANTISATTYQNLPQDIFVTGGTYTSGNVIFTNNSGGTFTVTGFAVGGGGGQTFYLNLSQSQNGNRLLSTTASTASEQTSGVTISNGVTSTIESFQSQPLNITLLPGGIWSFYLHSYKQNNNASFNIFVEVYKRTSGGTQTLLFTTDPAPVTTNSPNPSMQLSDGYFSGTPLSVSDSIVAVVRATNTGNQSHIITLVTEGSQHYSYAVSTIPTQQGLTCDTLSGCSIIQTIQTDVSNKLDKSGGTITGDLIINSGLTATTISATTYQNLPNTTFTGGTVSGVTNFTNGLTANTISATTLSLRNVANTFNGSFTNTNTADRVYTLPDTTGTIALTSDLSGYVPYTGASSNVNLGANSLFTSTLGVGVSSSLSSTAQIRGTSSTTGSTFSVQNSTPVNLFNVLNSGFVGIGTNTPISLLHIGTGSGTTLGDFTTPVITFNTLNNGMYLDSNRLFFKAAGAFNFGIDSTGVLGNQFRINGAASNNVTTPIFVPSRLSLGPNSGFGGNNAGDVCLITNSNTRLRINYNGDLGFFGVTPVARQTLGAATAGATYTATEQGMLQRVYDALRNYGLGT
jgi:hypothetical protein